MKVQTLLLHLLILGSLEVFGLRERLSDELAKRAVCDVKCDNDKEREKCREECNSDQRDIPVFDIQAKANVEHLCRSKNTVMVNIDSGVFAIEYRNQSTDWVWYTIYNFSNIEHGYHEMTFNLPGGRYQWRYTRVSAEGVSRPEVTKWVTWRGPDVKPTGVPDFWVECLTRHRNSIDSITAQIGFGLAKEDDSCLSYLECSQDQGNYRKILHIVMWKKQKLFFDDLPLGGYFTVRIRAGEPRFFGNETFVKFTTPPQWPIGTGPEICVPNKIENLNAVVKYRQKENIHDVDVTWRRPEYIPDFVKVGITVDERSWTFQNVSGSSAQTTFRNMSIWQQFDVSISAWSYLGRGPETSKSFTNPHNFANPSASRAGIIAIIVVASSVSFMMATGVCGYLIHMRLKRRRRLIKSSKIYKGEIDPDRLVISRVLGSGNFGVVKFGRLRDDNDKGRVTVVAVKMLRDDTNETELRNFRLEIEMMKSLDKHPNIVSLVGYRTSGFYPFLVVEYCPKGDLLSFLRTASLKNTKSAEDEDDKLWVSATLGPFKKDTLPEKNSRRLSKTSATVTFLDILNFGRQIATGMEYLSSKRVVHRDLAARNILVCNKGVVKISDFGLSRDIYLENMYTKTGNGQMPFKWMAIESLMHQVYTTQSDVWSFGILLWEIITLGVTPYPGVPTIEILKRLQSGYRMERPDICSEALYNVMLSCWNAKPKNRPTFTVLRKQLDRFIRVAAEHKYIDADYVSVGMALDEDLIPSSPDDTSCPLQASSVNDVEPRVILEGFEQTTPAASGTS